jgi:4-hydroxy-tetrahydrodipicolinate synthase
MSRALFHGSIPALITPFANGYYRPQALKSLIDWHVSEGSSGLVICGTTGESPTLSHEEHVQVVADAVEFSGGRISIIAGAGSNSTREAIALTKAAEEVGADAVLHVTGYYNKPTQKQVVHHFQMIDKATRLPIIVYNIPGRTGQELSVDTMVELAQLEHVVGVKDSTGNVARVTQERARIAKPFAFLSGDDGTSLGYIAHGGDGCISVTANVAPALCAKMIGLARSGDFVAARALQDQLMDLHLSLFLEPSPAGVKYAMSRFGLCKNEIRAPLMTATPDATVVIDAALSSAGLI